MIDSPLPGRGGAGVRFCGPARLRYPRDATLTTRRSPMDDIQVHQHIERLVAEEHELWKDESAGTVSEADARRLAEVKVLLDQCWDLLRQRRALREAELHPEGADVRQPEGVERYQP